MNHSLIEPLESRIAPASFTISAPSFSEGNSGTQIVTFSVTNSSGALQTPITLHYTTGDGTETDPLDNAVAGQDYIATSGDLVFEANALTKTFTVTINGDLDYEHDEKFNLSVVDITDPTTVLATAKATIRNDELNKPTISIDSPTVIEGNDPNNPSPLVFTVTLSGTSFETITVAVNTSDGTATANTDYTPTQTTLTFAPGVKTQTFTVPVIGDTLVENNETVLASLSSITNATAGTLQGTGTILSDEARISIGNAEVPEGPLGTTASLAFIVTVDDAAPDQDVTVHYQTQDGTALTTGTIAAGTRDYEPISDTVITLHTDATGHATQTINVTVNGDAAAESNETMKVVLSGASNGIPITQSVGVGTITNDDALLNISAGSVTEGNLGSSQDMSFAVTLDLAQPNQDVTVHYKTVDGTAVSTGTVTTGTRDYEPIVDNVLTLHTDANGHATGEIKITVNGDGVLENSEFFNVVLSNPSNGVAIQTDTAKGTINDNDTIAVTINDVTIVEGDSGQQSAVFVVSLTPAPTGTVSVTFTTANGTAVSDGALPDFTATSKTIIFNPGQSTQTIVVPILGDLVHEGTETFTVKLTSASGASIADDVGVGTIVDNGDPLPTINLASASVAEGDANGTSLLSFIATLSAPSQDPVTVTFTTQDGTATTADGDYTAKTQTITFDPGQVTKTFTVAVIGDTTNEGNETIGVQLSDLTGATLGTATATGTILNDDISASIANATFNEGDGTVTLTVTLSAPPVAGSTATVNYVLNAGSAHVNSDVKLHDPAVTSLVFNEGETTKTITLDIIDDTTNEPVETFTVALTGATGAVLDANAKTATGTINDNDAPPTVSITNQETFEGNNGTKTLNFTVSLSAASAFPVTVHAATVNGTAVASTTVDPIVIGDFTAIADQTITFAAGETTKTVSVTILGDTADEADETFQVQLSNPTNATLAAGHDVGTGKIINDDVQALSISDATIDEGTVANHHMLTFTVSLPSAAAQEVTVHYDTANGTAKAGANLDYLATSGTLTFAPGEITKTITVDVLGDGVPNADKAMVVNLHDANGATIADGQGVGRIVAPTTYTLVAVTDTNVEDDATTTPKTVTYKVIRSGSAAALAIPGTVTFTTADGTGADAAKAGSDYIAKSGTLHFAAPKPGETEVVQFITVDLRKDFANENDETFQVKLTGASGGVLRDSTNVAQQTLSATATITDNDDAPTITISNASATEGNPSDANATTDLKFTVSLSAADETQDVTVQYLTKDGTGETGALSAAIGSRPADFTAIGLTTLTIPKGSLTATFVVHVLHDTIYEGDETFTVELSSPSTGDTIATGTGTIKNDDSAPTITFAGANNGNLSLFEGNAGVTTAASFTVQLSAASELTTTVKVSAGASDTAKLGSDFTIVNAPGTLTFAPGETSKTLDYSITGDTLNETNETFSAVLSNATNGSLGSTGVAQATVTIKNDDKVPAILIQSVSAPEGNSGTTDFIFKVTLESGESDLPITVDFATSDVAALSTGASPDYQETHGTLTFMPADDVHPAETVKFITVHVNGDTFKEIDESFNVTLSNPTNATLAQTFAAGTILNDGDTTIGVTIFDAKITEGDSGTKVAPFKVQLSAASTVPVTVDISTRNGTAVAGADFVGQTTTLTFAPGQTTQNFNVSLQGDGVFEATESFFVDVKNPVGAQIIDGEARGTIYNDDLQIVNGQTVRYVDADGDLATVHITKGTLTTSGQHPVLTFSPVNSIGGRILQMIDFTGNRFVFNHTDVSVTADLQPGFSASGGTSDGRVDVGFIQGGIPQGSLFQLFDNIDFGNILVEGDLGKIVGGDQISTDRAVVNMNILSHGAKGASTLPSGVTDNVSVLLGGAIRISVAGDFNGVLEAVGGDTGDIENLTIKGALRGGEDQGTGQIFFTGTLVNAVIGSIVGGTGASSGAILGNFTNDATFSSGSSIRTVHVLGDIVGGTGANSGRIFAPNISTVVVDGNLTGGDGDGSAVLQAGAATLGGNLGSVVIKGNIAGGDGDNSGEIFGSKKINSVVVRGSLEGGAGKDSASIVSLGQANSVIVLGDIQGADGDRSGSVQVTKTLKNFQLGVSKASPGDLIGDAGANSGSVSIGRDLTAGVIFGSIKGGTGSASGGVNANGMLTKLTVGADLVGGDSTPLGPDGGVPVVNTTGFIAANRIGALSIGGNITSGHNNGTSLVGSATIRVSGDIGSLVVGGDIVGTAAVPVIIAAEGAVTAAKNQTIGTLVVQGDTSYADILGGYGGNVNADNPLGDPVNPDAQMGTIRLAGSVLGTNVAAGIDPGDDARFGTQDDVAITGGLADNPAIQSRIAAFIVQGAHAKIETNTDVFGVVAQIIVSKNVVSDAANVLRPGKADDFEFAPAGSNFRLLELFGA